MKHRQFFTALVCSIAVLAVLIVLFRCTEAIRSRRAVRDMTKALSGVLEERGEKGLLELTGADPDKLFYEYEGVDSYVGEKRAWDYSSTERLNMSVYETVAPSVVRIESYKALSKRGEGAGVIYSADGYIVTNRHVIGDGDTFSVFFQDGTSCMAELAGADSISDVAVLKAEASGLKAVRIGTSENTAVGEEVYAIGHPFGYGWSFSKGLLSGKNRLLVSPDGAVLPCMLQTDASVNPGNSGGPLVSSSGLMIGLVSSIYSPSGYNEGIAFALPSEYVKGIVEDIIATGTVRHGWIDAVALEVNPVIAGYTGLPANGGILISQMVSGGEAESAGVKGGSRKVQYGSNTVYLGGDLVTGINGKPVHTVEDYASALVSLRAGDAVDLEIIRGSREMVIKDVRLVEQTEENSRWLIQ